MTTTDLNHTPTGIHEGERRGSTTDAPPGLANIAPCLMMVAAYPIAPADKHLELSAAITSNGSPAAATAIWWARQDSNLRPNRYERSALTN